MTTAIWDNQPVTTVAIVQARMTSSRLPGKVLEPLAGAPMLIRQLERVARSQRLDHIVVATSTDSSDDQVVATVEAAGYAVVRGDLTDVLTRYLQALNAYPASTVVRITADCPLISPAVIDLVIDTFVTTEADYCSNTLQPTYPDGLDVEVVRAEVLREVADLATDPPEREHVTLGIYRRPERYQVVNMADSSDHSALRWTVDLPDDLSFVRAVYEHLYPQNPEFEYEDVLALLERHPELHRTSAAAVRNAALQGLSTGAMHVNTD